MKKPLTLSFLAVLLSALVVLSGLAWQQARQRHRAQTRLAVAERNLLETAAAAEQREARNRHELDSLHQMNSQLAEKVQAARSPAPVPATNNAAPAVPGDHGQTLSRVLQEPEMREVMRQEAKAGVQRNVKQIVTTNLIQQLGLNEDQAATLKSLVADKGMLGFDFLLPVMAGELDEAGVVALGRQTKAAFAAADEQIKVFLGEDGYRTFQWFEKSQPERERVSEFAAKLAGPPLTPAVQDQLLALMYQERADFHFTTDYNDTSQIDFEHFHDFYAADRLDTYYQEMERLNERIVQSARGLLTPEQTAQLSDALKEHLRKGKYVAKTTNALFGQRPAK
jgi:hypothetical protein